LLALPVVPAVACGAAYGGSARLIQHDCGGSPPQWRRNDLPHERRDRHCGGAGCSRLLRIWLRCRSCLPLATPLVPGASAAGQRGALRPSPRPAGSRRRVGLGAGWHGWADRLRFS